MRNRVAVNPAHRLVLSMIVIVSVLFFFTVSYAFKKKDALVATDTQQEVLVASTAMSQKVYEKDTDGDGLADWEEILWASDPNNPDSDGDGVQDKDEIFSSDTGEGLAVQNTSLEENLSDIVVDSDNATEVVAKQLFNTVMLSMQNGEPLSEIDKEKLIEESLRTAVPLTFSESFTASEIRPVVATEQTREMYSQTLLRSFEQMLDGVTSEYASLILMTQGDAENKVLGIQELQKTIDHYSKHIQNLKSVPVPDDAVTMHVNLVQALLRYTQTLQGFLRVNTDPLATVASLRVFPDAKTTLNESYKMIHTYMEVHTPSLLTKNTNRVNQ
jgi:Bacterial TSP3 repeat